MPLHGRPAVFARSAEALQLTQVSRRGGTDTFSAVAVAAARKPTTCAVNGGAWAPWSVGSGARTGPRSWGVVFFCVLLLGQARSSASGFVREVPGAWSLPDCVSVNEMLADLLEPAHRYAAYALAGQEVVRVGAALTHHFVDRDGLLSFLGFSCGRV